MELTSSEVKLALRSDEDGVVGRGGDLASGHFLEAYCTGRHQCIFSDAKRQLALHVPSEAPLEHFLIRDLPAYFKIIHIAVICGSRVLLERGSGHDRWFLHILGRRVRSSAI